MMVDVFFYLLAMLCSSTIDVVNGKELQHSLATASACRNAATVMRQRSQADFSAFKPCRDRLGVNGQYGFGPNNFRPMRAKSVMAESHVAIVAQGLEAVGQTVFFKDQADVGNGSLPTILPPAPVYVVDAQELKEVGSATDATRLAAAGIVRQDFGPNKTGAIQVLCVYNRLPALSADGFQAERMLGARRKELCGERKVGFTRPASFVSRLDLRLVPATAALRFEADKIVGVDRLLCAARAPAKPEVMKPTVSVGELKGRPAAECLAGEVFEAFGAVDKMQLSHDASLEQSVVVRVLAAVTSSRQDSFILSLFPHKTTSVELT